MERKSEYNITHTESFEGGKNKVNDTEIRQPRKEK